MRVIVDVTVQEPALPSPAKPVESVAPGRSITPLTITCPSQVVTTTPFDCTLTIVTTSEPPPAAGAALRVTVPPGLFHLENSANARFDADSRQLVLSLNRAPLATHTLSLSLMADDAGAGRTRTLTASVPIGERPSTALAAPGVTQPRSGEMEPVEAVTPVEALEKSRESGRFEASAAILVAPGEPVIVSALESPETPMTATLLIVTAIVAALWTLRARRRGLGLAAMQTRGEPYVSSASSSSREAIGASAIGAIVSVLLLFLCMPACIETVRARTGFVATTCTIVDRGSSGLAPEITYVPMAVVRYEADGRTHVATGFDVRGTMYGSNDPDASRQFATGGRYPCWYDPAQPQRVILRQGPSATAWFALLPVAVLMLTLNALLGVWRD